MLPQCIGESTEWTVCIIFYHNHTRHNRIESRIVACSLVAQHSREARFHRLCGIEVGVASAYEYAPNALVKGSGALYA